MELFTVALLAGLGIVGLTNNMLWVAVPAFIILIAYIQGARSGTKEPAPGGKPVIRPIIVEREYAGPTSIYPAKMKIRVKPNWDTRKWWERALGYAGVAAKIGLYSTGMASPPQKGWTWKR